MALRSLRTCYVIDRDPLTREELDESSRRLREFMDGFESVMGDDVRGGDCHAHEDVSEADEESSL